MKYFDGVGHITTTTGAGTVTLGAVIDSSFFTFVNQGAAEADEVYYRIDEAGDVEIGIGTLGAAAGTLARTTVLSSRIGGTAGTTKMNLAGAAQVLCVVASEALSLIKEMTGDSGSGGSGGLVPAPAAGDAAANKFLKADGEWQPLVLKGHLYGLALANNGADAANDIDISSGEAASSDGAVLIVASAMTKRLDANWSAGSAAGFRNSAAAITDTTYHIYAVAKAVGADPDYYAHTSTTVATVIAALQAESGGADYIYARRIGSILRESGAIRLFSQDGDSFLLSVPTNNANGVTTSTTAALVTTTVPLGLAVDADITFRMDYASVATAALITSPAQADTAASTQIQSGTVAASGDVITSPMRIRTNTSGQVRIRSSGTGSTYYITTFGWIDRRGRV